MEKVKNIISSRGFRLFLLISIILLGFYLRIIALDKPGGLWTDEIHGFNIANQSFPFGVIKKLFFNDIHAPLWFLFLNRWMHIFGNSDFSLRFSSVLTGLAVIPVMYLAGKEIGSRKTGIIAAALTCVNSLLIYYSQEVRFYSLLAFFGALSVLFLLKVLKKDSKTNYIGFILANLGILYTLSFGAIFVFIEALALFIYFYKKNRIKSLITACFITFILYIPYLPTLLYHISSLNDNFINPFDIYKFQFSHIFLVLQHWFTPVFTNYLLNNMLIITIFAIIPMLINIFAISLSISKNKNGIILFSIAVSYLLVQIFLAMNGKFVLNSRYTILSSLMMILLSSYGLTKIKNKALSYFLILALAGINLFYLVISPQSAPRMRRDDPYKFVANILEKYPFSKSDMLIMPFNGDFLYKYYSKTTLFPFCLTDWNHILDKNLLKELNKSNASRLLKNYITSPNPPDMFERYIKDNAIDKIDKNRYLIIVISRYVAPYNSLSLDNVSQDNKKYTKAPLSYMLNTKIYNDLLMISSKYLTKVSVDVDGYWEVFVFQKNNDLKR